ncbi:MAG TPA: phage holin family protein [Thermoanaerobaculia bacterium]|nr:phage holin family protein [Thermoanaerobaculia bacterium]
MWSRREAVEEVEEPRPGIFARIKMAAESAKELLATRVEIFKAEAAHKGNVVARGAVAFVIAAVVGWLAVLVLTALIAVLLSMLFGSVWAGLLGTFVLYLLGAAGAAFAGIKTFKNFKPFAFPETSRGLKEDVEAIRGALKPPPEREDATDVEQRFRAGSE